MFPGLFSIRFTKTQVTGFGRVDKNVSQGGRSGRVSTGSGRTELCVSREQRSPLALRSAPNEIPKRP